MRFEIKYTKMQKLNERGIYNLQGLTSYGFKDELLNEFNNILFYDNTIQSKSQSMCTIKILLDGIAKHETIYLIIIETNSGN
jgi:hypothetical protein